MEKISVIGTVLNEESNINWFISSILSQTKKPAEIIIVDGGSNDKTYKILKEISKKKKTLKVFQKKGANISQGRNYAIKKSGNNIIVGVDAGTKYKKNWLEELIKGFNGQMCFGINKPLIKNNFQRILAKKLLKNPPGSARNIIFSKKIWEEVGGFPEDLDIAEDTLFEEKIKRKGYCIKMVKGAIGFWEMRKNLEEVKKQFYRYGYWEGVSQRKYKLMPKKYKIAVILLVISFPFVPAFWITSKFSLSFKIDFVRRYSYLKGFLKGFFNLKE
jgi:glycosyltransferase involved in cell wall biosynthesis